MNQAVIGLSIAYIAVSVLLLGLTVNTRWPVWVKVASILLVSSLYFVTYRSLGGIQGWPSTASPPERFLLLAVSVDEPNKVTGSKGRIYFWATSLEDGGPAAEPRAYELQYSLDMHNRLDEANKRIRDGVMQMGKSEWVSGTENPDNLGRFAEKRNIIRIYDLPDPEMPEK